MRSLGTPWMYVGVMCKRLCARSACLCVCACMCAFFPSPCVQCLGVVFPLGFRAKIATILKMLAMWHTGSSLGSGTVRRVVRKINPGSCRSARKILTTVNDWQGPSTTGNTVHGQCGRRQTQVGWHDQNVTPFPLPVALSEFARGLEGFVLARMCTCVCACVSCGACKQSLTFELLCRAYRLWVYCKVEWFGWLADFSDGKFLLQSP